MAATAQQALVPSAAGFHIGDGDQRLRAHGSRVSVPGKASTIFIIDHSQIVGKSESEIVNVLNR
jgi:hypothetical protein